MAQNHVPVIIRVAQNIREGALIDVYALVHDLKLEFPGVSEADLERIVSEQIIAGRGNAAWHRRAR